MTLLYSMVVLLLRKESCTTFFLMNSAVMPAGCEGVYMKENISSFTAEAILSKVKFVSHIGYQNTARVLSELCDGRRIEIRRDVNADLKDRDQILAVQLKKRLIDPRQKGDRSIGDKLEDYSFSHITYRTLKSLKAETLTAIKFF